MSRARLTRRGELVVLLGAAIALGLLVASLRYRWVQAYGIAGAMVLGLFVTAAIAAYLGCRAGEMLVAAIRWQRHRRRPPVPAARITVDGDPITPEALARIKAAVVDELEQRRRRRA